MSNWTSKTLFGRDFFLQAIWLTSITTRKFYNIRGRHSTQNIWNNVMSRTRWFTMPMDQCTMYCQCSHFWLLKLDVLPHPPHSRDLAHCELFFYQEWNHSYDGAVFKIPLKFRIHCQPFNMWFQNVSSCSTWTLYITQNETTLKGTTTTNNKGKHIFHYQLRHGIFEQDLVYAKVKGFQWCASTQIYSQTYKHKKWNTMQYKSLF